MINNQDDMSNLDRLYDEIETKYQTEKFKIISNLSLKRHNLRLYRQNLKQRTMFPRNELDFQTVKLA